MKFKLVFTREYIEEGGVVPWTHGIAWRDYRMNTKVCYFIPFHIIFRWVRDFFFWIRIAGWPGYKDKWEKKQRDAWIEHVHDEFERGYIRGYNEATVRFTVQEVKKQL